MEGMNNLLSGIGQILHIALTIYFYIIIVGALISWVNPDPYNPVVRFLRRATEPLFFWLRRHFPLIIGGIDLSPIIALALVQFIDIGIVTSLIEQGNIAGNILIGAGDSILLILNFYLVFVIIAAVISFVNPSPYNPIVRILTLVTEPLFSWFRRRLPLVMGGIDFSPVIVIALIFFLNMLVSTTFIQWGHTLKKGGLF